MGRDATASGIDRFSLRDPRVRLELKRIEGHVGAPLHAVLNPIPNSDNDDLVVAQLSPNVALPISALLTLTLTA